MPIYITDLATTLKCSCKKTLIYNVRQISASLSSIKNMKPDASRVMQDRDLDKKFFSLCNRHSQIWNYWVVIETRNLT